MWVSVDVNRTWNITVSQVVKYKEQIEEHKIENVKIIEIDKVKE